MGIQCETDIYTHTNNYHPELSKNEKIIISETTMAIFGDKYYITEGKVLKLQPEMMNSNISARSISTSTYIFLIKGIKASFYPV